MKLLVAGSVLSVVLVLGAVSAQAQSNPVPSWIKNTALWYGEGNLSDEEFLGMIEFLIGREIIDVPGADKKSSGDTEEIRQELDQLRRDAVRDIQNAFDDGYEKGLSESETMQGDDSHYNSCDRSLMALMSGISDGYFVSTIYDELAYMEDTGYHNDYRYWSNVLDDYLNRQDAEASRYVAGCPATQDEKNLMALQMWYSNVDMTVHDACSASSYDGRGINECMRLLESFNAMYESEILVEYEADRTNQAYEFVDDRAFKTVIEETEVSWSFYDTKGNFYSWAMPVITYENLLRDSDDLSYHNSFISPHTLESDDGAVFTTVSLEGFVYKEAFEDVIDDLYDKSYSDSDFVWEVWQLASQMTVYDEDIHPNSEGRFALETLARSGGDCEDLAILIANMLYSSRYTGDWIIQYVYMDADNPTNPEDVDHVIVYIDDGTYHYYIEATGKPSWDYYPEGVAGWYFNVA